MITIQKYESSVPSKEGEWQDPAKDCNRMRGDMEVTEAMEAMCFQRRERGQDPAKDCNRMRGDMEATEAMEAMYFQRRERGHFEAVKVMIEEWEKHGSTMS